MFRRVLRFLSIWVWALCTTTAFATICPSNQYESDGVCLSPDAGYYLTRALPADYTRLEYLESTGGQYIDTGVYVDSMDINGTIDFQYTQDTANTWLAGAAALTGANLYGTETGIYYEKTFYTGLGAVYSQTDTTQRTTATFSVVIDIPYKNFYIFARNFYSDGADGASVRIYSAKIYDGNTLLRDFIPARRNTDGALGMYDAVNNVFYTNDGTDSFGAGAERSAYDGQALCEVGYFCMGGFKYECGIGTWGNTTGMSACEIVEPGYYATECASIHSYDGYTPLDYLESTGTQYIDTGVLIDSTDYHGTIDFQFTDAAFNKWFAGAMTDGVIGIEGGIYGGFYTGNGFSYSQSELLNRTTATFVATMIPNKNFYLFTRLWANPPNPDDNAHVKIFSAKIYDKDILIRNLIPMQRNRDGALGMYDTVNNVFHTNLGTGTFVSGNTITESGMSCRGQSICPAGYSCENGGRHKCSDGTYQDASGQPSCKACPSATQYADKVSHYINVDTDTLNTTPNGCAAYFTTTDASYGGVSDLYCVYSGGDNDYGTTSSSCYANVAHCDGGYYSMHNDNSNKITGIGIDSILNNICTNVGAGFWSADGELIRTACAEPLTTAGYGAGADEIADCGRILHFGDESVFLRSAKKTSPSLQVNLDDNMFYGNLGVSDKSGLKIMYQDTVYTLYDDSTSL